MTACPFCIRIERGEYDGRCAGYMSVASFEPLNPVTPGHRLFVPTRHLEHPDEDAVAAAMGCAEAWADKCGEQYNLITSSGLAATQTIPHIHVHYVPRRENDGLYLPWTGQNKHQRREDAI